MIFIIVISNWNSVLIIYKDDQIYKIKIEEGERKIRQNLWKEQKRWKSLLVYNGGGRRWWRWRGWWLKMVVIMLWNSCDNHGDTFFFWAVIVMNWWYSVCIFIWSEYNIQIRVDLRVDGLQKKSAHQACYYHIPSFYSNILFMFPKIQIGPFLDCISLQV